MKKQVLINVEDADIRVAILENGELTRLFVETDESKTIVGNIYKGKVESIVPGLKAVFVDIGQERNAFLHFSDVHRTYTLPTSGEPQRKAPDNSKKKKTTAGTRGRKSDDKSNSGRKGGVGLKVGEEILVQVTKDPLGSKGARISSYISLAGRFLVYLPNSDREKSGGISKRIDNMAERRRLRSILKTVEKEGNFIIRTAGLSQDEGAIHADVKILKRLWDNITKKTSDCKAPCKMQDDHQIIGRLVRDEFTNDIEEIIVDSKEHARQLRQKLGMMMPELKGKVTLYGTVEKNLFEKYEVESQFQKAIRHRVWLKSGAYLIIDETEAMVVIDVNTGKFVGKGDQEETIFLTNCEAAQAIARQLQLRDVGGIVVIDFIDMRSRDNQRSLVRKMKDYLKEDRAKTFVGSISDLGLLEMTRKRVRQSLSKVIFNSCPYCQGTGRVLTNQQVWKNIKYEIFNTVKSDNKIKTIQITTNPEIRKYLENEMLDSARSIANHGRVALNFVDDKDFHTEHYKVVKV